MVSYANRDQKGGCMGVDIENARTHPVTHILGHQRVGEDDGDLGYENGDVTGSVLGEHFQVATEASDNISFGPLPPGMYEIFHAPASTNIPVSTVIFFRPATSATDFADVTVDYPILSSVAHPYFLYKLTKPYTHLNFHNDNAVDYNVYIRRLT